MTKRPRTPPPPPDTWTRPGESLKSYVLSFVIPVIVAFVIIGLGIYLEAQYGWH